MHERRHQVLAATAMEMLSLSIGARAETEADRRDRILAETKVNAVLELTVPASKFKDDGDPITIEIVFRKKKSDGPSRATDDGEVIFLYEASDETQQKLLARAFEIRFAREESRTVK